MKAAFTIWDGRIAPVFDVAGRVLLVEMDAGSIADRAEFPLPATSPLEKIAFLAQQGVEVLVCGAISWPVHLAAGAEGLQVHAFVAGETDEVIRAWTEGKLTETAFAMPGCRHRRRHRRGHEGGRRLGRHRIDTNDESPESSR